MPFSEQNRSIRTRGSVIGRCSAAHIHYQRVITVLRCSVGNDNSPVVGIPYVLLCLNCRFTNPFGTAVGLMGTGSQLSRTLATIAEHWLRISVQAKEVVA